jgi:hypothetical protein
MPYDLYGQYYASSRDAENAELAQMAQIDAGINARKIESLERRIYEQQQPPEQYETINRLMLRIEEMNQRISHLEEKLSS